MLTTHDAVMKIVHEKGSIDLIKLQRTLSKRKLLGFGVEIGDIIRTLIKDRLVDYDKENDLVSIAQPWKDAEQILFRSLKSSEKRALQLGPAFWEIVKECEIGFPKMETFQKFLAFLHRLESLGKIKLQHLKTESSYVIRLAN